MVPANAPATRFYKASILNGTLYGITRRDNQPLDRGQDRHIRLARDQARKEKREGSDGQPLLPQQDAQDQDTEDDDHGDGERIEAAFQQICHDVTTAEQRIQFEPARLRRRVDSA